MKAAFRQELWLGCSGHNLNLVLSHVLQAPKEGCSGCPPKVQDLIMACKDLVTLAKKTRLNSKQETTLSVCQLGGTVCYLLCSPCSAISQTPEVCSIRSWCESKLDEVAW